MSGKPLRGAPTVSEESTSVDLVVAEEEKSIFQSKYDFPSESSIVASIEHYEPPSDYIYECHSKITEDAQPILDFKPFIDQYNALIQSNPNTEYKLIFTIRHGQGVHNYVKHNVVGPQKWIEGGESKKMKYLDPSLTPLGVKQAQSLHPLFDDIASNIQLLICSPLRRTIQTAIYAVLPSFIDTVKYPKYYSEKTVTAAIDGTVSIPNSDKPKHIVHSNPDSAEIESKQPSTHDTSLRSSLNHELRKKGLNTVIIDYARERMNYHCCDRRSQLSVLKKDFSEFDFFTFYGFETEEDTDWNGEESEKWPHLRDRMCKLLDYLWLRDERIVVYSGHCDASIALMQLMGGIQWFKPPNAACLPFIVSREKKTHSYDTQQRNDTIEEDNCSD